MTTVTADISALSGYLKKYDKQLIGRMLNGLSFFNDPTLGAKRGLRTPEKLYKYTGSKGVRRLNTAIEDPKSKGSWSEREIVPRFAMKILKFVPDELKETFMSEMLAPNAKRIPFAEWVMNEEFKTLAAEINDNIYNAVYATVVDYSATATYTVGDHVLFGDDNIIYKCVTNTSEGESPSSAAAKWVDADAAVLLDGPGTLIASEISGSNLAAYAGGAFTNADAYDVIKGQWEDDVTEAHKNAPGGMVAYVSYGAAEDIAQHQNTKFGSGKGIANADVEEGVPFYLKNTNKRLQVRPSLWMGNSRRIIITRPKNLVFGTDMTSDMNRIGKLIETLHGYNTVSKFALAFQIRDLEPLSVNDQA